MRLCLGAPIPCSRGRRAVLEGGMSQWLSTDDPLLARLKQKREAILAEVGHTHLATVYWPGEKGPWHTTYDRKPLNGQVTRWQVWIGEDGARRRVRGYGADGRTLPRLKRTRRR